MIVKIPHEVADFLRHTATSVSTGGETFYYLNQWFQIPPTGNIVEQYEPAQVPPVLHDVIKHQISCEVPINGIHTDKQLESLQLYAERFNCRITGTGGGTYFKLTANDPIDMYWFSLNLVSFLEGL